MDLLTLGAAWVAGVLTVLSPCVLPILPIIFGSAQAQSRWAPFALAGGVAVAFTAVGLLVATVGVALGLDETLFHRIAGVLLVGFGVVLLTPRLQVALETGLGPFSGWAAQQTSKVDATGLPGQFGLGALLGAVWSPCVGPTLGAASLLASQGKDLGGATLAMLAFGVGAAAPLLLIGTASRTTIARFRSRLSSTGRWGKWVLGGGMVAAGVLAASGADKLIEALVVQASPAWLTQLTTAI